LGTASCKAAKLLKSKSILMLYLSLQSKPDTVHQLFFILQYLRGHALIEQSLSWQNKKAAKDESNDTPE
jgi:hypothetical protein